MRKALRPLILLVPLAVLACGPRYPGQQGTSANPVTVKIVDAKRPPVTLIATDRSTCLVTTERYRNTRLGDAVYCHWSAGQPGLFLDPTRGESRRGLRWPRRGERPAAGADQP